MTQISVDIEALKIVTADARQSLASKPADESVYAHFRWFVKDAAFSGKLRAKAPVDRVAELRGQLNNAARTAQQHGATPAQINYIVSLAVAANDFNILSGGRLTKFEASRIIEAMKN